VKKKSRPKRKKKKRKTEKKKQTKMPLLVGVRKKAKTKTKKERADHTTHPSFGQFVKRHEKCSEIYCSEKGWRCVTCGEQFPKTTGTLFIPGRLYANSEDRSEYVRKFEDSIVALVEKTNWKVVREPECDRMMIFNTTDVQTRHFGCSGCGETGARDRMEQDNYLFLLSFVSSIKKHLDDLEDAGVKHVMLRSISLEFSGGRENLHVCFLASTQGSEAKATGEI
jgi:hypothetical protein